MARFNKALSSANFSLDLLSHSKVLFAILLIASIQLALSSPAYAEPENPETGERKMPQVSRQGKLLEKRLPLVNCANFM